MATCSHAPLLVEWPCGITQAETAYVCTKRTRKGEKPTVDWVWFWCCNASPGFVFPCKEVIRSSHAAMATPTSHVATPTSHVVTPTSHTGGDEDWTGFGLDWIRNVNYFKKLGSGWIWNVFMKNNCVIFVYLKALLVNLLDFFKLGF